MNGTLPLGKWVNAASQSDEPLIDIERHRQTYRNFVFGAAIFAAHCLAILAILAFVFSDSFH